jgi:hypothetical protein
MATPLFEGERSMAGFVQIIEYTTSKFDEGQKLVDEYRAKTAGRGTAGRAMVLKDRDTPNKYFTVVQFASYEEAMKNQELPETNELAQALQALADGPPVFHNLDVVREEA